MSNRSARAAADAADYPDGGEPPIRSALRFPPCRCPEPDCALKEPQPPSGDGAEDGDGVDEEGGEEQGAESPVLADLRARIKADNERRRRYRQLGRRT